MGGGERRERSGIERGIELERRKRAAREMRWEREREIRSKRGRESGRRWG